MLIEQTLEKLTAMQLHGMVTALRQWQAHPPAQPLTPADLVGLLADAEWVSRENRKLTARLKAAKLKLPACVEDVDYRHSRGLSKTLLLDLGRIHHAHRGKALISRMRGFGEFVALG